MTISTQSLHRLSDEELHLAIQTTEQRCAFLMDSFADLVFALDEGGMITAINQAVAKYGYAVDELIGQSIRFLIFAEDRDSLTDVLSEAVARKENCSGKLQLRIIAKAGTVHRMALDYDVRFDAQGRYLFMQAICHSFVSTAKGRDIELSAVSDLEKMALIRNAELMLANEELRKEVIERREAVKRLRKREAALESEKSSLEESNTALRVLLKRRASDKHDFEEQVLHNVQQLILPYLDTLKTLTFDQRQQAYLTILETNLNDITKSFTRRLALEFHHLTPSELKVAIFVRQGKRTREIASLLGLSMRTIDAYRQSIRRKLRIQNKRVNLRTFLLSIN